MATWAKVMPDYELRCWDAQALRKLNSKFADQAYSVKQWAFASDYTRLYALYNIGGIYLDTDVKVFRKFDPFLNNSAFASIESYTYRKNDNYKDDYWMDAAMLGAEKGNPFIKDCLDYYENRDFIKEGGTFDQTIISHVIADIAEDKYGFVRNVACFERQDLKGGTATIYPPYVFSHRRGDIRFSTCAIHLFVGGWRKKSHRTRSLMSRIQEIGITCTNEKIWGWIAFKGMAVWYFAERLFKRRR